MESGLTDDSISAADPALHSIPVIGSIFRPGSSYLMTYQLLCLALDDLTRMHKVVKAAYGTDENNLQQTSIQ